MTIIDNKSNESVGGMTAPTVDYSHSTKKDDNNDDDNHGAPQAQDNKSSNTQQQQPVAILTSSSSTNQDNNKDDMQYNGHPDEALFLGRWVLVNSQMSTPLLRWTSGDMITTRHVNDTTGKVEYHTKNSWKFRFCYCCCISGSNSNISIYTSRETFTMKPAKTGILDGDIEYGRFDESENKFICVGKKGTNEVEYRGDRCYMKIIDARYSLVAKLEYERVETFS